jgi:hypothetical protein
VFGRRDDPVGRGAEAVIGPALEEIAHIHHHRAFRQVRPEPDVIFAQNLDTFLIGGRQEGHKARVAMGVRPEFTVFEITFGRVFGDPEIRVTRFEERIEEPGIEIEGTRPDRQEGFPQLGNARHVILCRGPKAGHDIVRQPRRGAEETFALSCIRVVVGEIGGQHEALDRVELLAVVKL